MPDYDNEDLQEFLEWLITCSDIDVNKLMESVQRDATRTTSEPLMRALQEFSHQYRRIIIHGFGYWR